MKKSFFVLITTLILISTLVSACQAKQPAAVPASSQNTAIPPVKTSNRVVSEGSVVPAQYANLTFSTPGVVDEVTAAEGQAVKSGEAIARLKGATRLQASLVAAQAEQLAAQQTLDDLNKNADVAKAAVQLRLAQADKDLKKAKEDRDSKNYQRASQSNIDDARASLILANDAMKQAEDLWSVFEGKDENNLDRAAALMALSKARYNRDRAQANLNYAEGRPDAMDVALADGKLAVAQATYDQAQRDWELVKDGPNPDQVALAESRLNNAKSQIEAAKAALDDLDLSAPFDGTIVSSDLKVGQLAGPQTSPVLLADLSNYQVKTTDLTELNVVDIKEGTPVKVTFDAIPGLELNGKVLRIKTLGEDKQGDVTYTVTIQLDQQDARLRWNMTASVVFQTK